MIQYCGIKEVAEGSMAISRYLNSGGGCRQDVSIIAARIVERGCFVLFKQKPVLAHSIIFTILMIALIIFVYNFNVPNPNMILIAALVLSTAIGGSVPGRSCSVLMLG